MSNLINTREIDQAFKELIGELQNVKELNSISLKYKDIASEYSKHVDSLSQKLEHYYRVSGEKDVRIKTILDDSIEKLSSFEQSRMDAVNHAIIETKKNIEDESRMINNILKENRKWQESKFAEMSLHIITMSKAISFLKIANIVLILTTLATLMLSVLM